MLINHNSVISESLITASVEFLCKKSLCMSQRICGIIDDQVISGLFIPQEPKAVFIINVDSLILQSLGNIRKHLRTYIHKHFIGFHHINALNLWIMDQFSGNSTVTAADDQNIFYIGMYCHWHMRDHFIINKFIFIREYDLTVQSHKSSEFFRLKHIDSLKFTFP